MALKRRNKAVSQCRFSKFTCVLSLWKIVKTHKFEIVHSMFLYEKNSQNWQFEKSTTMFLKKSVNIDKFEKGTLYFFIKIAKVSNWGLATLSKKQGGSSGMNGAGRSFEYWYLGAYKHEDS